MTDSADAPRRGAVILTGGTAARMDGADKASIEIGGFTLLERALAATVGAAEVVVVGEQVPTSRPVTWTREDPVSGGPAAGLLAALDRFLRAPHLLAVLAVDMPHVTPGTFARLEAPLLDGSPSSGDRYDGALLVDGEGRRQLLCAVYRPEALQRARPSDREAEHGLPMRTLLAPLRLAEVAEVDGEALDVDTWSDLRALRERRHESL